MLRVYCDFDGTLAAEDVGNRLFRTFGGERAEDIVRQYRSGQINARECLSRECHSIGQVKKEELLSFVSRFRLDPHAVEFVRFCRSNDIPLTILSDGLDLYVEKILSDADLGDVPWFANRATWIEGPQGAELVPSFPYRDEHCDRCGNCKRNHIVTGSADDDVVVYIGDGFSDRCPVRYADIVFAKNDLLVYCQQQNISYFEFRHLGDVRDRLEKIVGKKRIKQRREAVMARRDVFIAE